MWKQEIEQPPPTPGLAQWAWNSLFSRETPMSKYNAMKAQPQQSSGRAASLLDDDTQDITREDTFHYKRAANRQPLYARDDTDYKKNVSWGGKNYMARTCSSDIENPELPRSTIRRDRDMEFCSEKDLLPDLEDDYTFTSHRSGGLRRSRSASYLDIERPLYREHTSLPQAYPGRFPSPYVHKDDLLSSGTKNLMTADSNAEKNKHIQVDSSPPIPQGDWKRRLGLASQAKLKSSMRSGTPLRPVTSSRRQYQRQEKPLVSLPPASSASMFRRSKTIIDYSPTLDQNEILRQLDQNALELEEITTHINKLKADDNVSGNTLSYTRDIDVKYKRVREELIQELKKSQKLYDSYYRFVGKYKDLKTKYEKATKDHGQSQRVSALEKEILLLKDENQYLKDRMNEKDVKLQEDTFTLSDLKSTLQSSSNFEVTLRRKIRFLEDKLEQERQDSKKHEFQLKENIYMMEMKAREDEERLRKAEERFRELEAYDDSRRYDILDKLSPLRNTHSYIKTPNRSQRPLSMGSLGVNTGGAGFKYNSKYTTSSASLRKERPNDDLHEDTIDRLIKETL